MPLAATLKSQMLRLLRRSKSTRSNQAMVIPNKRYSAVIPETPSVVVTGPRESSRHRSYSHSQARRSSKVRGARGSTVYPGAAGSWRGTGGFKRRLVTKLAFLLPTFQHTANVNFQSGSILNGLFGTFDLWLSLKSCI